MNGLPLSSLRVGAIVALASVALAACGADDAATVSNTTPAASQSASQPAPQSALQPNNGGPSTPGAVASPLPSAGTGNTANAFNTPAASTMNAPGTVQDNPQDSAAILSAQASLAADNQQIAPVLRYAPGDDSH